MKNITSILRFLGQCVFVLALVTSVWMCKKPVEPDVPAVVGDVYTVATVDQPPTPQGGQMGLGSYLQKNLRYPAEAQRAKIQGKVIVGFVVTDVGHIANVKVNQGIGGGCDEEAVRVVEGMPDWTPGQLKGKPVNVQTSLPLSFTLL